MSIRPGTRVRSGRSITWSAPVATVGSSVTAVMTFPSMTTLAPSSTCPESTSRTPLARRTVTVRSGTVDFLLCLC